MMISQASFMIAVRNLEIRYDQLIEHQVVSTFNQEIVSKKVRLLNEIFHFIFIQFL